MQRARFIVISGPSGSGKSSLLRAGIVPRLRASNWAIRIIKPGEQPGQGVGYLDDGTMVVVESGRDHVNQGDKDFSAILTMVKKANPDILYMSLQNHASGSLMAIQAIPLLADGCLLSDVVTVGASLDFVMGEVDR